MGKKKFIRIEGQHILYTKNNWKTILYGDNQSAINDDYELENNSETIYEARLRHKYRDEIASIIIGEFRKIEQEYFRITNNHLNNNDGFGDHFEIFAISILHNMSYERVIRDYLVKGQYDGGVDAIVYNENEVKVYQIKLNHLTNDNTLKEMESVIDEYENTKDIVSVKGSHLKKFLDEHYERDVYGKSITYWTISNNSNQDNNIKVDTIYNLFLGNELERSRKLFRNSVEIDTNDKKQTVIHKIDNSKKELFLFSNAESLVDSFTKHIENTDNIDYLFVDNVRGRLKKNKQLIETIETEPDMFCFYNNGISIVGEFNEQINKSKIVIANPVIINGQQTMYNLFLAKKDNIDISKVFVPVFLKEVDTDKGRKNIAKYNNSQTKITSIDILSIDKNLRTIQSELLSSFVQDRERGINTYYLDIIKSGSNKNKDRAKLLFDKEFIIPVGDFVKLYTVVNDNEALGKWKNNLDTNISSKYKNGFDCVNKDEAIKICDAIQRSRQLTNHKNEYRIADLMIQFLLYYGYTNEEIISVVNHINELSDSKNINRANAYRQLDAITTLRNTLKELNIDNKFDKPAE